VHVADHASTAGASAAPSTGAPPLEPAPSSLNALQRRSARQAKLALATATRKV